MLYVNSSLRKPNTPGPVVFGDGYPQQEASLWISENHNMLDNHSKFASRKIVSTYRRNVLARATYFQPGGA